MRPGAAALRWLPAVSLTVASLAACGGGGAGTSMREPPEAPVLDPVVTSDRPRPAAAPACRVADGALEAGEALPPDGGAYRLVLFRSDAAVRPAWVAGRLELSSRPPELQRLDVGQEAWTVPLQGIAQVEIERVGAYRAGALDSTDPAAPGVLVLRSGDEPPTVLIRLGSAVNRTDRTAFDEAFTVLTVRRIEDAGFAGSWRSGRFGDEVRGYFCATAVSE